MDQLELPGMPASPPKTAGPAVAELLVEGTFYLALDGTMEALKRSLEQNLPDKLALLCHLAPDLRVSLRLHKPHARKRYELWS